MPLDAEICVLIAIPFHPCILDKKNRAYSAAKSREETPKEGIYSQRL
jgi:hypothetical protein